MLPDTTLVAAFDRLWHRADRADRLALVSATVSLTYGQLRRHTRAVSQALQARGVAPGDYVAIAMERSVDQVVVILGAMMCGACPSPLEPRIAVEETARRVAAVGLRWLVHDAAHVALAEGCGLAPQAVVDHAELLGNADAGSFEVPQLAPEAPALLLFTSGSTGHPKGVLLSHQGVFNNATGVAAHTGLAPQDRLLHVMPLHHTNALNNQLFAPLWVGACVALAGRFRAEDMPELLETFEPTLLTGVPTMYARMAELPFSAPSLARLRFARCGSAPITERLHRQIEDFLGCPLIVSYGLSEATCTSTLNPPHARRVGSVGTVLPNQTVVLMLPDGTRAATGADGEICIAGDSLMLTYLGAGAAVGIQADGYLHTGDLGRFDTDGYLYITGRIKDVIIRGGENISPSLIEAAVVEMPGVASCCVVGAADDDLGEVPVIFIVPCGTGCPDLVSIRAFVLARLGRIYVPAACHVVDRLPENAVGKIDRKALAARIRAPGAMA